MKRLNVVALLCALFVATPLAHAELWQTANVYKQGSGGFGAVGQYYFDPSKAMLYGQFLYGVGNNLQIEARMGGGGLDFYVGMFVKDQLIATQDMSVAIWSGFHSQGNAFWDIAPIFSHNFGRIEFYFGPYVAVSLGDRDSGVTLNPGFRIPIQSNLSVYSELALKVSHIPTSVIGGLRYSF